MAKGHKPGGGIKSRTVVEKGVRTGAERRHIQKASVAQLGQMQGDHATNKGGSTGYTGVSLIGPSDLLANLWEMKSPRAPCAVPVDRAPSTKPEPKAKPARQRRATQCPKPASFGRGGKNSAMPNGELNGASVLLEEQVTLIRQLYLSGEWSFVELAQKFSVTKGTIQAVLSAKNWAWNLTAEEADQLRQVREERSTRRPRRRIINVS
jgi:hypothetical protein